MHNNMEDELEQRTADYLSSVLGFNGERIDPVLGGYHLGNGYRLYSPSLRRFTSPDSMSPFGVGGESTPMFIARVIRLTIRTLQDILGYSLGYSWLG